MRSLSAPISGILSNTRKRVATEGASPDPRLDSFTKWMKTQREGDIAGGQSFAEKHFGAGNPEMAAVLAAQKNAAFGTDPRTALAREAGNEGINRQVQTALRQFQGRLPGTGVQGGAAGAMAGMLTRDAVGQTRGLERDLALGEMDRRSKALNDYTSGLTGERAGLLGTTFAHAGLGSQDRFGAMGYLQGKDFLDAARAAMAALPGGPGGPRGLPKNPITGIPMSPHNPTNGGGLFGGMNTNPFGSYDPGDPRTMLQPI